MKPLLLLVAVMVMPTLGSRAFAERVTAADPLVQVEGRTAPGAQGAVRAGFPGVVFRVRVEGPHVVFHCTALSDTVYLDVAVDGGPYRRVALEKGPNEVELFNGANAVHGCEVVKRTESWRGELVAQSFEAPSGRFLLTTPLPERRLLFLGDSITCGEAADVRPDDPPSGAHNGSGRHAFGWLLARRLDAQAHLVSYGGRGVLRTWEGKRWPEEINAPQVYGRSMPDDPDAKWDASDYTPDAVVICLGTNDFNLGVPDHKDFVDAYVNLLRTVRHDAPEAWVFVVDSPMFGPGEKGDTLRVWLDEVVDQADLSRVERVALRHYPGRPVDSHPVAAEHAQIAGEIEPLLRRRLGW